MPPQISTKLHSYAANSKSLRQGLPADAGSLAAVDSISDPLFGDPLCYRYKESLYNSSSEGIAACMNGDASKLHGILLKYKIKFRSIDLGSGSPFKAHYAGVHRWRRSLGAA